jgi:hypothetical protein
MGHLPGPRWPPIAPSLASQVYNIILMAVERNIEKYRTQNPAQFKRIGDHFEIYFDPDITGQDEFRSAYDAVVCGQCPFKTQCTQITKSGRAELESNHKSYNPGTKNIEDFSTRRIFALCRPEPLT